MSNPKQLFRQKALDELNSAEALDQMLQITSARAWIGLAATMLVIFSLVIWSFAGSIPVNVKGDGILLAEKGSLYNAVAPEGAGRITKIIAKRGQLIEKGAVVALLDTPNLQKQIDVAHQYLTQLKKEKTKLINTSQAQTVLRQQQLKKQNQALNKIIKLETENLKQIESLLSIKLASFKKGITTQQDVSATRRDFYATKKEIERAHEALSQNKIKSHDFSIRWQDKLTQLNAKIEEQIYKTNDLKEKHTLSKEVQSPISGVVTSIQSSVGAKVKGGDVVATISSQSKGLDALVYVPANEGKRIKNNMHVLVSPSTIKKEEFGSLKGRVVSVSSFPATRKEMLAILQNEELVKRFSKKGAPIVIRIQFEKDNAAASGYRWTSSKGPEQTISAGTLLNAMITIRKQRPIALLIPTLKKILGEP
jgi:HlyD family secretion protein